MTEEQQQQNLEAIKHFTLMDDTFMTAVFDGDKENTELLLHIILGKDDLKVSAVEVQRELKNLHGHSVRLDILATDSSGKVYNIEVQRNSKGANIKRARYNSSMIDASILNASEDYEKLPETYVVFITEHDVLGLDLPLYNIERTICGTDAKVNDGTHIVYVNGAKKDGNSPLALLMQDFYCDNPDDMNFKQLAEKVSFFKEDKKGVTNMCKIMDELAEKRAVDRAREIAKELLNDGMPYDKVAKITKLPLEEVMALDGKKSA